MRAPQAASTQKRIPSPVCVPGWPGLALRSSTIPAPPGHHLRIGKKSVLAGDPFVRRQQRTGAGIPPIADDDQLNTSASP